MYTKFTSSRERARGARQKNDRQPDPLLVLFERWGGGVTKNLVEYLVEWPPKFEKNITPVLVLQVASKRGTHCATPRRKRPAQAHA